MNTQKLNSAIAEFTKKKKSNAAYYEENWAERKERKEYYQSFTKDKLLAMTEEEFLEYISKLWSMLIWGNKKYVVDKMIADNGFAMLKKQLAELLYSTNPIEKRWDVFLKSIKGMGPATISELLTYANPQEYVIFNKTTILCYGYLDIPDMPKYNYQYTGKKYAEVCAIAKKIAAELKKAGADDYDLLAVDYFMWDEILPLAEKKSPVSPATPEVKKPVTVKDSKSLHDEIKEKLVAIGELLGFDSRSEVKITTGAVVDAVWEAKIGNMGKAIYVFEVQSKGSIDSLILNLKKAQSNAAVQAVVAVADEEQLAKIIRESAGVIDEKSLRTWDSEDECVESAKVMATVYTAIAAFENMVRQFVVKILMENKGENWWTECVSDKIRKSADSRKAEEDKIKWHTHRGTSMINYVDFADLANIMGQNYDLFEVHIVSLEWAKQIFTTLEKSRNVIMHSGELGERDIERIGINIRDWISQVGA